MINPQSILDKYFVPGSKSNRIVSAHSRKVAEKAVAIVDRHPELGADRNFVWEAAMLHDIGIVKTWAPTLDCFGDAEYLCHGYLGHDMLVAEGLPKHALVCERHTGTGFTIDEIILKQLPLPHRNLQPQTIEEKIVCYADKFFSKDNLEKELQIIVVEQKLMKYGNDKAKLFRDWSALFE